MIAALGWNHRAGLAAASPPALAGRRCSRSRSALAFAARRRRSGLVVRLSRAARAAAEDGPPTEWYPIGRVLVWMVLVSARHARCRSPRSAGATTRPSSAPSSAMHRVLRRSLGWTAAGRPAACTSRMSRLMAVVAPPVAPRWGRLRRAALCGSRPASCAPPAGCRDPGPISRRAPAARRACCCSGARGRWSSLHGFPACGASLAASLAMAYCVQGLAVHPRAHPGHRPAASAS